jgi:hypothetical protein
MKPSLRLLCVSSSCALFASCGALGSIKNATVSGVSHLSTFSVTDLMPARVGVVEVRQKDLKELPLGKERAMAYEAKKQNLASRGGGFWFFKGPVDFKEPTLPSETGSSDGSLLPPRAN